MLGKKLWGIVLETSLNLALSKFFHSEDQEAGLKLLTKILNEETAIRQELRFDHQNGKVVWLEISASQDSKGGASGTLTDITERKQALSQIEYIAYHDALTGLLNRVAFVDYLEQAIAKKQENSNKLFAVLFLDLDGFKLVNDSLGHLAGDKLLVAVAQRLKGCLKSTDTIARFGGDEFNILLTNIINIHDVTRIASRINKALKQPFNLDRQEVFISTSIGIVLSTNGGSKPEHFLRNADIALYRAKSQGKAAYEIFDQLMHIEVVERLQLETDLRRGLEREEFEVYYQPIISLNTNQINGFEALVRWHHPTEGLVAPDKFISIAEETGLIVNLGWWILKQACLQTSIWQQLFNQSSSLFISLNLSSKQFSQLDLLKQIEQILEETGLKPQHLKLEITESTLIKNLETTNVQIKKLSDYGIKLSIDDFGTGYSSLNYLRRFSLTTLKIDRSFISPLNPNTENIDIVEAIIVLAHKLGMDVVAEGVETMEKLEQLRRLNCEQVQGYLFSPPVPANLVPNLLSSNQII